MGYKISFKKQRVDSGLYFKLLSSSYIFRYICNNVLAVYY